MNVSDMIKVSKANISWLFEYILVTSIILECNSLLSVGVTEESRIKMTYVFTMVIIGACLILLFIKLTDKKTRNGFKDGFLPVALSLEVYTLIYFILGVFPSHIVTTYVNYVVKFMIFLPLMASIIFLEKKYGKGMELLLKYSNIVCIIAFLNLLVYYTAVFHMNEVQSELVYLRWYNLGDLSNLINFFNVCYLKSGATWQSVGVYLLRDLGPFAEPLMFLIPLGTALFVELFLRPTEDSWCLWRSILLSVTVFTAQSTYGLMFLLMAWGIKFLSMCSKKEKVICFVPAVALIGAGCVYFVRYKAKQRHYDDVLGYLMQNKHITDYIYPLQAFLKKPLLAGGFLNDELTFSFFSEKALSDKGFSNSIAVILGQGGIVLGILCMLPFIICFIQVVKKKNRNLAMWVIGPFFMYTMIAFYYRYYMIFIFAIGYGLLEIERGSNDNSNIGKIRLRLLHDDPIVSGSDTEGELFKKIINILKKSRWMEPIVIFIIVAGLIKYGAEIWNILFSIFDRYQLSSGQSAIRVYYAVLTVIIWIAGVRWLCTVFIPRAQEESRKKHNLIAVTYMFLVNIVYFKIYSVLYSYVDTLTVIGFRNIDFIRETMLLCAYILLVIFALIFFTTCKTAIYEKKSGNMVKTVLGVTGVVVLTALSITVFHHKLDRKLPEILNETEVLKKAAEVSEGNIYTDVLSVMYKRAIPEIKYTVTKGNGFRTQKNATILEEKSRELTALFNAGYKVAQISDGHILYSNDEKVIEKLSQEGYKFYRYYAFSRDCDLQQLAELNELPMISDDDIESLVLEGENRSLIQGPYEILQPGRYTVSFRLKINIDEYETVAEDTVICRVSVSHKKGKATDQVIEVTKSRFDETGRADVDSIISTDVVTEGYEYKVVAEGENKVGVQRISVRQTPKQITIKRYNVYQRPAYEAYYGIDGQASYTKEGYAARVMTYNYYNKVMSTRYLDENAKPVMTTKGYAEIRYEYDEKQQLIQEAYFDEKGNPVALEAGQYMIQYVYDERGNKIEFRYCDAEGRLLNRNDGIARICYQYDDNHNWIREDNYNSNGEKVLFSGGFSSEEREYTVDRLVAVRRYLGVDGQIIARTDGVAERHYFYNDKKQNIRQEFYGIDRERTLNSAGVSAVQYERDYAGNVVDEKYYDLSDGPVLNTSGIFEVKRKYNNLKQKVSEEFYGVEGVKIENKSGVHRIEYEYDLDGNVVTKRKYKLNGELIKY